MIAPLDPPFANSKPPLRPGPLLGDGEGMLTVLESIVTAAVCARARPLSMIAPVSRVMLADARMLPSKAVVVPRVAELPTCQNRPSSEPLFRTHVDDFLPSTLAVVSRCMPIWNTQICVVQTLSVEHECSRQLRQNY